MFGIRARICSEQQLGFQRFPLPSKLEPGEVLVQVDRTIISAGTELANYTGLDPDTRIPGRWCAYPWTPGYGGIGRILAAGDAVKDVAAGDRVYGIFHHGTHCLVDTTTRLCVRVPKELDSTTASFVRMGNVAITGLRRSEVALGDGVAIIGLGLVGNLAGQFFIRNGQRVIGIDVSERRRALAEEVGFTTTFDPRNVSTDELAQQIGTVTYGRGPRVVVDAVGDSRIVEQSVFLTAHGGQVIMLGTPRAACEGDYTPMLNAAHKRGIDIKGALEWVVPLLKRQSPGVTTEANAEIILRMLRDGSLRVKPLLTQVIAPQDLNAAYQGLLHQKDRYLGVVLDWENNPAPKPDLPDVE